MTLDASPTLLSELTPGLVATVVAFVGDLERTKRLREMGLLPGTKIKFVRWAPLGDPLEIELRGYRLSLRRHEAELIQVTPVTP
ncbi:MAG TPA: ferrous iron transport protein A [Chthoniobacterales bacterium]